GAAAVGPDAAMPAGLGASAWLALGRLCGRRGRAGGDFQRGAGAGRWPPGGGAAAVRRRLSVLRQCHCRAARRGGAAAAEPGARPSLEAWQLPNAPSGALSRCLHRLLCVCLRCGAPLVFPLPVGGMCVVLYLTVSGSLLGCLCYCLVLARLCAATVALITLLA